MGDKSPKSKQREQKQAAKVRGAAEAKSKQDNQSHVVQAIAKGKK